MMILSSAVLSRARDLGLEGWRICTSEQGVAVQICVLVYDLGFHIFTGRYESLPEGDMIVRMQTWFPRTSDSSHRSML